jgi:hypothetical protein
MAALLLFDLTNNVIDELKYVYIHKEEIETDVHNGWG